MIILIITIYLIGAVLAYGRVYAEFSNSVGLGPRMFFTTISWLTFIIGAILRERGTPFLLYRNPDKRKARKELAALAGRDSLAGYIPPPSSPVRDFENNPPPVHSWR